MLDKYEKQSVNNEYNCFSIACIKANVILPGYTYLTFGVKIDLYKTVTGNFRRSNPA